MNQHHGSQQKPPAPRDQPASADDASRDRAGNTRPQLDQEAAPRLPHEHDESADSHAGGPAPVIEQARKDVEKGLVDTDRGAPSDKLYKDQFRPG